MYLIHKEGKSVVAERFIRTLKEQHFYVNDFKTKKRVY